MLTERICKAAKYPCKPAKLYDSGGLHLHVKEAGKYWRFQYRFAGKRKIHSIGVFPKVSLKEAREKHEQALNWLEQGLDPNIQKKLGPRDSSLETFEIMAGQWLNQHDITDNSKNDIRLRWEKYVFPIIGGIHVAALRRRDVMQIIETINVRGAHETANRVTRSISQVLRYCMMHELCEVDVTTGLGGAIKRKRKVIHYPAITDPHEFGTLLRAIKGYSRNYVIALCLNLAPYLALRPTELREGRWSEIDFDNAEWRIPESRMKKDKAHFVPLSESALNILRQLHELTGSSELMFPSPIKPRQALSPNTLNVALKHLGYAKRHSPHGFRSTFSTMANRAGYNPDVIESQLAHLDADRVRAAYLRADWLEERRELMQWWSDEVDMLRKTLT